MIKTAFCVIKIINGKGSKAYIMHADRLMDTVPPRVHTLDGSSVYDAHA